MKPECIVCHATSDELPLIALRYQQSEYYICPSHLPILIHQPQTLVGILPGAEHLEPHQHDGE